MQLYPLTRVVCPGVSAERNTGQIPGPDPAYWPRPSPLITGDPMAVSDGSGRAAKLSIRMTPRESQKEGSQHATWIQPETGTAVREGGWSVVDEQSSAAAGTRALISASGRPRMAIQGGQRAPVRPMPLPACAPFPQESAAPHVTRLLVWRGMLEVRMLAGPEHQPQPDHQSRHDHSGNDEDPGQPRSGHSSSPVRTCSWLACW